MWYRYVGVGMGMGVGVGLLAMRGSAGWVVSLQESISEKGDCRIEVKCLKRVTYRSLRLEVTDSRFLISPSLNFPSANPCL